LGRDAADRIRVRLRFDASRRAFGRIQEVPSIRVTETLSQS
jgi:hypothetical protein